jgi:hypothetical protein
MDQWPAWFTVDFGRGAAVGSPEHGLTDVAVAWSSPRLHQNGEGVSPVLTSCSDGRWRGSDGPVIERCDRAALLFISKCYGVRRNEGRCRELLRGKWS